ncbi:unnamed protein product [Calypogeia fissa]
MVDIGRISSRKWAIALLVFLCVSAVLFIAPWILSVFYESDPYENWDEELRLRSQETDGNMTLWCTSGLCVACTSSEKAEAKFKCSPTGYHKAQQCAEDRDAVDMSTTKPKDEKTTTEVTKDPIQGKDQKPTDDNVDGGAASLKGRGLVGDAVSQTTVIYKTCIPQEVKEKLSVFGFEGVVLVCLLLSAPAVHYRKKRGAAAQGLQRIPSTARF